MKTARFTALVTFFCLAGPALSQIAHFPDLDWKEKLTDHFAIRTRGTGTDPARRYAEKVWDECLEVLPGLEPDFADNKFRTPGGNPGSEDSPYRFTVYLVGSGGDYRRMIDTDAGRNGWNDNTKRSCMITRNYADPHNRYTVFCKADPENSGGGGETDLTPVFIHNTASTILEGRSESSRLPFWMTAGFGYYVEHMITDRCRVYYIDFQAYYQANDAELVRGGVLGPDVEWPDAVQRLCKKDVRESLKSVCNASILHVTPNQSGYIFALTYFLVSDEERVKKYRQLVAHARDGKDIDKDLLLETYGYADDDALEEDWYEFIESRKFK